MKTKKRLRKLTMSMALVAGLTVAAIGPTAGAAVAQGACGPNVGNIPDRAIAIQTFTVRSAISSLGLDATLEALSSYGYQSVERFGGMSGLELPEFKLVYRSNGIQPVGSHGSLNVDSWNDTLATAKYMNQRYVGSGGFPSPGMGSLENTLATAETLNHLGERAAARGLKVQAHNHAGEFTTQYMYDADGDGTEELTSAWEIIAVNVNPAWVSLQLDVHWARVGLGLDNFDEVLRILSTYQDVIDTLHVKDTSETGGFAWLGEGTTDWGAVFTADPTIRFYIAENDQPGDALGFAEAAYDYLDCLTY